jgi:hypothetical protein
MTAAADVDVLARLDFEHELPCEWHTPDHRTCSHPAGWLIRGNVDGETFARAFCDSHMWALLEHRDSCGNCRVWTLITSVTEIR